MLWNCFNKSILKSVTVNSEKLSFISINNEVNVIGNFTSVETLVKKYADVLKGLGHLPGKLLLVKSVAPPLYVGGRNKLLPCFFKKQEINNFWPKKNLHDKNQRVSRKQRSKHEELTITIRYNLVD